MTNRLRELREAKGLTLDQVGKKAGATNQEISLLELGQRKLTVEWLLRLSAVFDCHPWDIVDDARHAKTRAEDALLQAFRALDAKGKQAALHQIKKLASKGRRSSRSAA